MLEKLLRFAPRQMVSRQVLSVVVSKIFYYVYVLEKLRFRTHIEDSGKPR